MYSLTSLDDVYKLFLSSIQDYQIRNLFDKNPEIADDMMETFLLRAMTKFRGCDKNLSDIDVVRRTFLDYLTLEEKAILADLMVLSWMDRVVNDITQMNLSLTDLDFKHFSEEKNLKEKSQYADRIREKVYHDMLEYELHTTPIKSWAVGDYV